MFTSPAPVTTPSEAASTPGLNDVFFSPTESVHDEAPGHEPAPEAAGYEPAPEAAAVPEALSPAAAPQAAAAGKGAAASPLVPAEAERSHGEADIASSASKGHPSARTAPVEDAKKVVIDWEGARGDPNKPMKMSVKDMARRLSGGDS